jgi:hypothetical protein
MPAAVRSNQWRVRARLDVEYLEGRRLLNGGPLFEIVGGAKLSAHVKVDNGRSDHDDHDQGHKETSPAKVKEISSAAHGHSTTKNKAADHKDQKDQKEHAHPVQKSTPEADHAAALEATTANAAIGPSAAAPTEGAAPHGRNDGPPARTLTSVIPLPGEEETHDQEAQAVAEEETSDLRLVPVETTEAKEGQGRHLAAGFDPVLSLLGRLGIGGDEAGHLPGFSPTSAVARAVPVASSQPEPNVPADTDAPRVSELLAAGIPFDALTLDLSLENFLKRVNEVGERLGHSLGSLPLQSWLVAGALAVGACEIARRQLRHSARYRLFSAAAAADSLSWSLTLTAPSLPEQD